MGLGSYLHLLTSAGLCEIWAGGSWLVDAGVGVGVGWSGINAVVLDVSCERGLLFEI